MAREKTQRAPRKPRGPRKPSVTQTARFDYKDFGVLQKFLTDRGKIVSRRISGITAKQQRELTIAIKRARLLGLLPVGSAKRK